MIILNIQEIQKYSINKLKENNIYDYNLKAKLLIAKVLNKPKEYLIINGKEKETKVLWTKGRCEIKNTTPFLFVTDMRNYIFDICQKAFLY